MLVMFVLGTAGGVCANAKAGTTKEAIAGPNSFAKAITFFIEE